MRFIVAPRLLDHFGVAMYNSIPKAIAELCANSYDADASRVRVTYSGQDIQILDDGRGMTAEEVREDYLRLGRDRRSGGGTTRTERTPGGRPVIGNKGIGKLAGFGIARVMTLRTWREGEETILTLDREDLDAAEDLGSFDLDATTTKRRRRTTGTEVRLSGRLEGIAAVDEPRLRAYLARHLPARAGWSVIVNNKECTPRDIPGERYAFIDHIPGHGTVAGYYIVASDRRALEPGFSVRIRGRVVQEPSLFGLNQQTHGFFNLVRITGELEPDFIDPVEGERSQLDQFVIDTSRSGFNHEDPAVQALESYAKEKLEAIASGLAAERNRERKKAALKRNPAFEDRLRALGPEIYDRLTGVLDSVISRLAKNEDDETVDEIVDMLIRYYESDALRVILESLRSAAPDQIARLSSLLARYGTAQVTEVAELLHAQLEIIDLLRQKVAEGAFENEIHTIIAANIWLVRNDLTYWFDNRAFATQLRDRLAAKFRFASGKRPDLVCYDDRRLQPAPGTSPTRLVVVEFKRPGIEIGSAELQQVMLYKSTFQASLGSIPSGGIAVIILGDSFDRAFDREALQGYVILSYTELLENARDRYRDLYDRLQPSALGTGI